MQCAVGSGKCVVCSVLSAQKYFSDSTLPAGRALLKSARKIRVRQRPMKIVFQSPAGVQEVRKGPFSPIAGESRFIRLHGLLLWK